MGNDTTRLQAFPFTQKRKHKKKNYVCIVA